MQSEVALPVVTIDLQQKQQQTRDLDVFAQHHITAVMHMSTVQNVCHIIYV